MSSRQEELSELQAYIKDVDKEVTMILQSLQWDRKLLLQHVPKITCTYDSNHKVPLDKLKEHEEKCVLKSQSYARDDIFLPDVFDPNSNTVMKLTSENIKDIVDYAAKTDPGFKKGECPVTSEPLTAERLQATYSADERRAIYDVVIHSRPACDELTDLALGEAGAAQAPAARPSRLQRLAELRDLRRRRVKYRVAARSRNYSNTLRGLIDTQMEMYTKAQGLSKTKSHDQPHGTNTEVNEGPSNESFVKPSDTDKNEHRTRSRYDSDRRNSYGENKRKRDHDDDKAPRNFENNRYKRTTEERETHGNHRSRRRENNRDSYREDLDIKYDDDKNIERYRKFIKEEMDSNSSSSKSIQRHRTSEREEPYYKNKDRTYIKEERDRYSSISKDNQRYRESEGKEQYSKDKDRYYSERHRSGRNEHKRYNDDDRCKKEPVENRRNRKY